MIKVLTFITGVLICTFTAKAQNDLPKSNDMARITLTPVVARQANNMPEYSLGVLQNKLQQIVVKNGLGAINNNPRFIITCKAVLISDEILPGPPAIHALNMDLTLYIADNSSRTVFSTLTLSLKGTGTNENKAYINAISKIDANSDNVSAFIKQGKKSIIEYYNSRCDFIIKEAMTMVATDSYSEAIYNLMSIPEVCFDCYEKALNEVPELYRKYINYGCKQRLTAARAAWIASPNREGADLVSEYLSEIYPDASCYQEAQTLVNEIKEKIIKDENRDWNFMLRVWDGNMNLENQRIKAMKEIGVAWGSHQPENEYDINWIIH